jgi:predicted nucleotidyltransferase
VVREESEGLAGQALPVLLERIILRRRAAPPSLESIRDSFVPVLKQGGAHKAIVFGSYARGDADEYSDLDLIIVASSDRNFFHRHEEFSGIYDVWDRAIDLLIYTPDEFSLMIEQGNPFIERALEEGVVIYEE